MKKEEIKEKIKSLILLDQPTEKEQEEVVDEIIGLFSTSKEEFEKKLREVFVAYENLIVFNKREARQGFDRDSVGESQAKNDILTSKVEELKSLIWSI